jgi:uncharacterized membrane protein YjjP (DUF1212 family)
MSGGEASRIEDTIIRIGKAYDFLRVDAFTITSSIILTVHVTEDEIITQTRRIKSYNIDMKKVEMVNSLSRTICSRQPSIDFICEKIKEIQKSPKYSEITILLAYGLVAGSFAIFFGGNGMDAVVATLSAFLLRTTLRLGNRIKMNQILLTTMCSAVVAIVVMLFTSIGLGTNVDKIVIGNVMLLIPGLALASSLRDMISGDIITGLLGISESILKAMAIALGFAVLLLRIGG